MDLPILRTGIPLRCPSCRRGTLTSVSGGATCAGCGQWRAAQSGVLDLTDGLSDPEQAQRDNYDSQTLGALQTSDPYHSFVSPAGWRLTKMLRSLRLKPGDTFLEVACAAGPLSDSLATNYGARGIAIDISPASVRRQAERRSSRSHFDFVVASAHDLPLLDSSVNLVLAFDVVEHLHEPERLYGEAARVLTPGGKLLIRCPVFDFGGTLDWWQFKLTPRRWMARMKEAGHFYENFRTKQQHREFAVNAGLTVRYSTGYDIFWDNFIEYAMLPRLATFAKRSSAEAKAAQSAHADGIPLRVPQSLPHKAARLTARITDVALWPERLLGRLGVGASMWLLAEKA